MHFEDQFDAGLPKHCEGCGERRQAGREVCWLCGRHTSPEEAARQMVRYVGPFSGSLRWQFSLKSLMLLMTFASVLFAVCVAFPEFGFSAIAIAIHAAPIALRTCALNNRYLNARHELPLDIRFAHVLISFVLLMLIGWAGVVAGSTLCMIFMVCGPRDSSLASVAYETIALANSVAAAGWFMWFLIRQNWPKQYLPPTPLLPPTPPR